MDIILSSPGISSRLLDFVPIWLLDEMLATTWLSVLAGLRRINSSHFIALRCSFLLFKFAVISELAIIVNFYD